MFRAGLLPKKMGRPLIAHTIAYGTVALLSVFFGLAAVYLFHDRDPKFGILVFACLIGAVAILLIGDLRQSALFVAALSIPLNADFRFASRGRDLDSDMGLYLGYTDFATIILLMLLLLQLFMDPKMKLRWCWSTTVPWLAFIAAACASLPDSIDKTAGIYALTLVVKQLLLYFAVVNSVRNERDIVYVLCYLSAGLILGAALYILSALTGQEIDLVSGRISEAMVPEYGDISRVRGTFGHPIQAGQYFISAMWIPLALVPLAKSPLMRISLYPIFGLSVIAMGCTFSRAAYATVVAGFLCYFYCGLKTKSIKPSTVLFTLALGLFMLLALGPAMTSRIDDGDDGTLAGRTPLMRQALYMVSQNPINGVGVGTYAMVMDNYVPPGAGDFWRFTVHNEYLFWWAETGTIGLLALIFLLVISLREGLRAFRGISPASKAAGMSLLCMFAAIIPNLYLDKGLVGSSHSAPRLFAVLLGLVAASRVIESQHGSSPAFGSSGFDAGECHGAHVGPDVTVARRL